MVFGCKNKADTEVRFVKDLQRGEVSMSRKNFLVAGLGLAAFISTGVAFAAEPDSCKAVHFADVGWTDITANTATASVILEALGYTPDVQVLSVPVTYTSLKSKDIDVFLGNWMPSMAADLQPYLDDKSVESIKANLEVHLLDREIGLYGQHIEVTFRHKLREEKKFGSVDELRENIARDIENTRAWFDRH